ncbi:benzoate membrane transport protein [Azospirillum lipoferum]|uniref:Benzoate/H(+) symporter BenE family transporter n=1 Tax=Azospirillum lipoferum TaxID=193 RepID=A0A5A9GFJ7_AZOLI|nr:MULTISPECIES: benzoate/H(+) symporter BenE family transporter [Azospirillum]KAA0593210.1 benzoate/H(+) symporter BenE family transporter [Azospirillum lipoferum]MCP1613621.1 benzoate membrane transport protein [Azospirillum lipoferum]MDW5532383.1 benzoate/H(+) symporter BenE family transporter [Azospirillum sp. NL1]
MTGSSRNPSSAGGPIPAAPPSSPSQARFLPSALSVSALVTGLLTALVGYAGSVAVVVQGLAAAGADTAQIASALVAVGFCKGVSAIWLAWRQRQPISIAWTTPGMALLGATGPVAGGFPAVVGAFLAVAVLIMVAGLWTPLGRWIAAIPKPLASAMLAGLLLKLCLAPFLAMMQAPGMGLLILATWAVVGRVARLYAVPAAVAMAFAAMALDPPLSGMLPTTPWPSLLPVVPAFTWEAMVGLALPLFVVTMASQNIPGLAVLATYGYTARVRPTFLATGLFSALGAPFGAPTVNLAAITAAMCAGPDADPRPERRWQAAAAGGLGYIALTALATITATLVTRSPPILIEAVAGLALIGAFGGSLLAAVQAEEERIPALVTLLVTASGLSLFGVGSAFWGLLFGGAMHVLHRRRPASAAPAGA